VRPTTTVDLTDREVVADPYPHLAEERSRHTVAWHEGSGRWMTFSHAAASAVQRDRRLGRLWVDREPAGYLEPFNLLHRNQMMENEPPEHTRLRRPVAAAFNRGHVERLRPRVRELAASLLDEVDPAGFDVLEAYAEPLPVLVIAELLGVPGEMAPDLRRWSQAIVRMYEPVQGDAPRAQPDGDPVIRAAVEASTEFADYVRELVTDRRARPGEDLVSDLAAGPLSDDEVVASVVLLLNAGHEASVNVFGNGLVGLLSDSSISSRLPGDAVPLTVEEMLRFDSALQLFERTATAPVEVGGITVRAGEKIAALLGAANRDPAVFEAPDAFRPDRDPNPHLAFGVGVHFCLGAPLARMELAESLAALRARFPELHLAGEPVSRGTFVLRGYRSVPVAS
jgi:cytochrome P450